MNKSSNATFGPDVIKNVMLNSAEHEILNAHKYKNIKKFSICKSQISIECYFPAHNCWHFNSYEQ